MKKLIIAAVIIVFSLSANADANTNYAKRVGGYFYTSLSPYGTWIDIGFGTPVWRPTIMKKTWSPYYHGQWVYTDYGWYWDSYEPFGAIVYHYGRWFYDDYYGWIWIPDDEWAPAWVDWRYDDDYIGWAPLSPYALLSINIGIHYTHNYYVPYQYWNYVKYNHFCDDDVYRYYVGPKYKYRVYERTKTRTNYSYYDGRVRNDGIGFDKIRERSGRKIEKRNIVTVNDPRELTKERNSNNRNMEIRTYIANRDDISRDGLRDVKVERSDRKSSLDLSKVELGRDRNLERTNERNDNRDVITRDRNENINRDNRQSDENIKRDVQKDVSRDRVNEERKIQERNDTQRRNSEIEKRNNDQIRRNEEIKRNEDLKRNEQIELQRKQNEEMKKRNDVNIYQREDRRSNTEMNKQNNDRKIQQRNETQKIEQRNQNSNINRNTEVRKNDSSVRNESRNNSRTEDKDRDVRKR